MAIRLTGTYGTTYYNQITVEIHDTDFAGDPGTMNLLPNGLIEKTEGEYLDVIKTTNYKVSMWLDNDDTNSYFDDLIEAEEGRFHLVVYRGSQLLFKGRIIVDSMTRDHALYPTFTFMAIDGITLLKSKKITGPSGSIKDWIIDCLNLNDVVNKMYSATDNLCVIASNLQFDDTYYDGIAFYENTWNPDYYYRLDGNKYERWTGWEILTEIFNRYGLHMRYWKGVYHIFGIEFPYEAWVGASGYKKNGTGVAILVPGTTVNIDNQVAYDGGKYMYENGLKSVQITAKKEYANAYFGENLIWEKTDTAYQSIGTIYRDTEYKALITLDATQLILNATGPYPPFFSVKMWVKETNQSTGAVTYLRTSTQQIKHTTVTVFQLDNYGASVDFTEIAYVLQTGKFEMQYKLPSVAYDRKLEFAFQFYQYLKYDYTVISGSPNVTSFDYKHTMKVGAEPLSTAKDIYFRAEVETDNVREKVINNYACDYNGNDLGKTFFFDGGGSSDRNLSTNRWRFSNSESWGPLEPALCRKLLEYNEANIVKLMIPCKMPLITSESIGLPTAYVTKFSFNSVTYFPYAIEIDHLMDIVRLSGVRVNAKSSKTITAYNVRSEETNPQGKETAGDTSNFGSYNEYQKGKCEEHIAGVTGDWIQLDYEIPTGSSYSSIRQSVSVFVEGVRWRHIETLTTNNANRSTYALDDDGKIYFWPYIPNKRVIVTINNYFETGIST